VKQFKPTDVTG